MEPNTQPSYYQRNKFLIIKLVLSGILIFCLVYASFFVPKFYDEIMEKNLEVTDTYRDIFPKSGSDKLTSSYTFFKNSDAPIASFLDSRETYKILVYKLNVKTDKKIDQLVTQIAKEPADEDNSGDISSTTTKGYKVSNQRVPPTNIQGLKLYLSGDSVKQLIKNDTLLSYGIKLKKLKVYDEHAKLLSMLEQDDNVKSVMYAEVLFYKKKEAVYVLYKLMRIPKRYEYNNEMYKLFTAPESDF
ncbi:MAG: hypothetical protein EOO88_24670 [Pedobacter sp.]|nr:MAG: hypothetical protein EOO88_24670 [Pedobacter sp.]